MPRACKASSLSPCGSFRNQLQFLGKHMMVVKVAATAKTHGNSSGVGGGSGGDAIGVGVGVGAVVAVEL